MSSKSNSNNRILNLHFSIICHQESLALLKNKQPVHDGQRLMNKPTPTSNRINANQKSSIEDQLFQPGLDHTDKGRLSMEIQRKKSQRIFGTAPNRLMSDRGRRDKTERKVGRVLQ